MPQCRIQPRTWYVEFGLDVSAAPAFAVDCFELEQPTAVLQSDSKILLCIKDVMDKSNQGGRRYGRSVWQAYRTDEDEQEKVAGGANPGRYQGFF